MFRGLVIWMAVFGLCAGSVALGARQRPRPQAPPAAPPTVVAPAAPAKPQAATTQISACGFAVTEHLVVTSAAAVQDGREIQVESVDGIPRKAVVVRSEPASGLALLRTDGDALGHVGMAETFDGGDVQCIGLVRPSMFQPVPETIDGTAAKPSDKPADKWTVDLKAAPRLAGAPLVVDKQVVGVALVTDTEQMKRIPAATPQQVAALLADVKLPAGRHMPPADAIVRVTCTKSAAP